MMTCELFDIDPYSAISEGTLLAAVSPDRVGDVLSALEAEGIPASAVGEFRDLRDGLRVVDGGSERDLVHPGIDPFWTRFEEYLLKQSLRRARS
jgi:hydrogenase expression/formation protein HypE